MLRLLLALFIFLHGLIHFIGFGNLSQITKDVSRPAGWIWLLAAILFIVTATIFLTKKDWWWMVGIASVVLSQVLISTVWSDARMGTIANLIILVAAILSYGSWQFEKGYGKDVANGIKNATPNREALVTETDIQHLPVPVQNYLKYVGVLNKPKLTNTAVVGCIHETEPMMAICTLNQTRVMIPLRKELVRAMPIFFETAIAAKREAPPTHKKRIRPVIK